MKKLKLIIISCCFFMLMIYSNQTESNQVKQSIVVKELFEDYYQEYYLLEKSTILCELVSYINDSILKNTYYGVSVNDLNFEITKNKKYYININSDHLYYMENQRKLYNIPPYIYYRLVYRESLFKQKVISPVGAYGYMQVMKQTFDWLMEYYPKLNLKEYKSPYDNIKAGSFLLGEYLKNRIDLKHSTIDEKDKWIYVLSCYNAGIGRYLTALRKYKETINYVDFIMYGYT